MNRILFFAFLLCPNLFAAWSVFNTGAAGVDLSAEGSTISGSFTLSRQFHFVADTGIGGHVRRLDQISASGKIAVNPEVGFDGRIMLGHFETQGLNATATDFVGIFLQEGFGSRPGTMRAMAGFHWPNGALSLGPAVSLRGGVDYEWSYNWTPTGGANGGGQLRCLFIGGGETLESVFNPPAGGIGFACNAFGLAAGYSTTERANRAHIVVSNPVYTALPKRTPPRFMRVIQLIGQSNGRGADPRAIAFEASEFARENTFIFTEGEWVLMRPGDQHNGFGAELAFACAVADRLQAPVGIIKRTVSGGRGLETEFTPAAGQSYPVIVARIRDALSKLDSPILAGVLAVQGETDADNLAVALRYGSNMSALMEGLRADLNAPELPMFVTRLPIWGSPLHKAPVRAAQEAWGRWVNTDDIEAVDAIHFSGAGLLEIGRRLGDLFIDYAAEPRFAGNVLLTVPGMVEASADLEGWASVQIPSAAEVSGEGIQFFRRAR